jgi:hypothetical protein
MLWKRILLLSALFFVLIISLVYFVLPKMLEKPLRVDATPAGAYVVPWMRPNPSIEELLQSPQMNDTPNFSVDEVMAGALNISTTFQLEMPEGKRAVPSTIYLGHDGTSLYVGAKLRGMYTNPVHGQTTTLPNTFQIYFDVNHDGILKTPESGSRLDMYVERRRVTVWIGSDVVWIYSSWLGQEAWIMAERVPGLRGELAMGPQIAQYDNATGTVVMIFSRFLAMPNSLEGNALQMRTGERWVMGFLFELRFTTNIGSWGDYVDGWPRNIYPYSSNDASWWPKMAIDLSNPPLGYNDTSTQSGTRA